MDRIILKERRKSEQGPYVVSETEYFSLSSFRSHRWTSYVAGMLAGHSLGSLYQDALGKDAYLEKVSADWISAAYTVPLALAFIALSVWLHRDIKE